MNSYKQIEPTERLKEADVAYALMDRAVDSGVLIEYITSNVPPVSLINVPPVSLTNVPLEG